MRHSIVSALIGVFVAGAASAQTSSPVPVQIPTPPTSDICCAIPPLTSIKIEFADTINSQANHIGDHFAFRLASPIEIDGKTLVPAGTLGSGDVVHAAKSRFGGRPGELILAVRYLDYAGVRIPLRSLTYSGGSGKDNSGIAAAAAIAGGASGAVLAMFITGKEVNVPAGTIAYAKVAAPTTVPPPGSTPKPQQEGSPKP